MLSCQLHNKLFQQMIFYSNCVHFFCIIIENFFFSVELEPHIWKQQLTLSPGGPRGPGFPEMPCGPYHNKNYIVLVQPKYSWRYKTTWSNFSFKYIKYLLQTFYLFIKQPPVIALFMSSEDSPLIVSTGQHICSETTIQWVLPWMLLIFMMFVLIDIIQLR